MLGLQLILVDQLDGTIELESDKGTKFIIKNKSKKSGSNRNLK